MARQISTQGETFDSWRRLFKSLTGNGEELPHLDGPRAKLGGMIEQAQELVNQQRALAAQRQEVSKKIQALLADGRRLADFLQTGIREHYGTRAEKLTEFGLQPFRGRKTVKPQEPEPPPVDPKPQTP